MQSARNPRRAIEQSTVFARISLEPPAARAGSLCSAGLLTGCSVGLQTHALFRRLDANSQANQRNPRNSEKCVFAVMLAATVALAGCGMPSAPLPPSLNLPNRVTDLSAVRAGSEVQLAWTMPTKNTDKLLLKGAVAVRVCRNENASAACSAVATLQLAPGADAAYTDTLPPALAAGAPRAFTYFVELDNRKGRSAGLSNPARILAGQAPAAIDGLAAAMRRDGVLLRWPPAPPDAPPTAIRLVRKLLTPPAKKPAEGPLSAPAEPVERSLLVEAATRADRALDSDIHFGNTYEYRAQRVARVAVDGKTLELAGPLSAPVRIAAINVFPPAVPTGLAAVATTGESNSGPAIDLSWLPNAEPDLAGYIVYRREGGSDWRRISPAQLVAGPGFHDAGVAPGHTYIYAVSSVDQQGHESARSAEAEETVPAP